MATKKTVDTRAMLEAGRSGGEFAYRGAKARGDQEKESAARVERGVARGSEMLQREGHHQDAQKLKQAELTARQERLKKSMGLEGRKMSLAEAKAGYEWNQAQPPPNQQVGPQGQPGTPDQGGKEQLPDAGIGQVDGAQQAPGTAGLGQGPMQGPPVAPPETNAAMLKGDLAYKQGKGYHSMRPEEKAKRQQAGMKSAGELSVKMRNADTAAMNAETAYQNALTKRGEAGIEAQAKSLKILDDAATATQEVIDDVMREKISVTGLANAFPNNPEMDAAVQSGDTNAIQKIGMRLLKAKRDTSGLRYMAKSGQFWSAFDPSSDTGRKVTQLLPGFRDALNFGLAKLPGAVPEAGLRTEFQEERTGLLSQWKGIQTDSGQAQFARKTLARLLIESQERFGEAEVNLQQLQKDQQAMANAEKLKAYEAQFGPLSVGADQAGAGNVPTGPNDAGAAGGVGFSGDKAAGGIGIGGGAGAASDLFAGKKGIFDNPNK